MSIADVIASRKPWHVECGDALAVAKTLPSNCLNCICTSPPYFNLRDYGTGTWDGGDPLCEHSCGGQVPDTKNPGAITAGVRPGCDASRCKKCGAVRVDQQIGLESSPDEYAAKLTDLFRELWRALHPSGMLWLNLGDSFNGSGAMGSPGKQSTNRGTATKPDKRGGFGGNLKPKDLIGVPWLVAFALRADGWYLRQWMPWVVRNKMPESADDRPSTACETVFLLSRESDYFFDMEAVKRMATQPSGSPALTGQNKVLNTGQRNGKDGSTLGTNQGDDTRNFRSADLWFDSVGMLLANHLDDSDDETILGLDVPTQSYRGSHFAVWPQRLVANFIAAGTSERGVCPHCFAPHVRLVSKQRVATRTGADTKVTGDTLTDGNRDPERHVTRTETVGWEPSCSCPEHEPIPSLVYDPFTGSGTTGKVALDMNRRFLGSELNKDYFKLIEKRMRQAKSSLF